MFTAGECSSFLLLAAVLEPVLRVILKEWRTGQMGGWPFVAVL
jgi:hypothetical protein